MLPKLLLFVACAAAGMCFTNGAYHSLQGESFATIDYRAASPPNASLSDGQPTVLILRGEQLHAQFHGNFVEHVTASVERVKFSGLAGEYNTYENELLWENDDGKLVLTTYLGLTTYANTPLHGFGYAIVKTPVPELDWINYAMFVSEWQTDVETGAARIELFGLTTENCTSGEYWSPYFQLAAE